MKPLLFILLIVFLKKSYGQEIELQGRYGASFIGGESIEFVGKDSFYFGGFYCTYGVHGKGRCEIRNNYLYLYFEKSKAKVNTGFIKSPDITKVKSFDSVAILNITCIGTNDSPIAFATIQLRRKGKTSIGTISDSLGHASFII